MDATSPTRRLVVAAALVDDLGAPSALLAARRSTPPALAGRWEFPGGKAEPGETPHEALHRELREELGIVAELGDEVPGPADGLWEITPRHVMRLWLASVVDGDPQPLVEHDELRWLPVGEWFTVDWLDADVPIVEALAAQVGAVTA